MSGRPDIQGTDMDFDVKKEARRQYLHYFRILFPVLGVMVVLLAVALAVSSRRGNGEAPQERVYDYADVLTDQEEESLRELIQRTEKKVHCDIVLVTIREPMEGEEAIRSNPNLRHTDWELNMRDRADDFYDENLFGYNKVHGNGVLLLDNWYEGQAGSHLCTTGSVYNRFGDWEIDQVLDEVYTRVEAGNVADAYSAYVRYVGRIMRRGISGGMSALAALVISTLAAVIFVLTKMKGEIGSNTVTENTYVAEGSLEMKEQKDEFLRKNVTSVKIESSSGEGGSHGGGGGGHVSHSGVSHGGGSRRR